MQGRQSHGMRPRSFPVATNSWSRLPGRAGGGAGVRRRRLAGRSDRRAAEGNSESCPAAPAVTVRIGGEPKPAAPPPRTLPPIVAGLLSRLSLKEIEPPDVDAEYGADHCAAGRAEFPTGAPAPPPAYLTRLCPAMSVRGLRACCRGAGRQGLRAEPWRAIRRRPRPRCPRGLNASTSLLRGPPGRRPAAARTRTAGSRRSPRRRSARPARRRAGETPLAGNFMSAP
jgi:hypothetical protein